MKLVAEVWRGFGIVGKTGMIVLALGALFVLSGTIRSGKKLMEIPSYLGSISSSWENIERNLGDIERNMDTIDTLLGETQRDAIATNEKLEAIGDTMTEIERTLCEKGLSDCR